MSVYGNQIYVFPFTVSWAPPSPRSSSDEKDDTTLLSQVEQMESRTVMPQMTLSQGDVGCWNELALSFCAKQNRNCSFRFICGKITMAW